MTGGPVIYNIFPRLAGRVTEWHSRLPAIKKMGFTWIYLNPVNYPGFSGSLYAIKDFYKFNPAFAPAKAEDPHSWEPLAAFIKKCHASGLRVMHDLVINHTSIDSDLISEHKNWYVIKRCVIEKGSGRVIRQFDPDGDAEKHYRCKTGSHCIEDHVAHPCAIDPADARKVTIWGDLAEIDNEHSPDKEGLLAYWKDLVRFYQDLGFDGFRCDAAYKVPPATWQVLIAHARERDPAVLFVAETLGCTLEQMQATVEAGFDYIFSSSKWWDLAQPWCVEQYNQFRAHAPSISFPESHDTKRLAAETEKRQDVQELRYLIAAFFSAGVMIPIGFELGYTRQLNVVKTRPTDRDPAAFNISDFITKVNAFKRSHPCLNEDGPITHVEYGNNDILVLRKTSVDGKDQVLLVVNKHWDRTREVPLDDMDYFLPGDGPLFKETLGGEREAWTAKGWSGTLAPCAHLLFSRGPA